MLWMVLVVVGIHRVVVSFRVLEKAKKLRIKHKKEREQKKMRRRRNNENDL